MKRPFRPELLLLPACLMTSAAILLGGCTAVENELAVESKLTPYKRKLWAGEITNREYLQIEREIRSLEPHSLRYNKPQLPEVDMPAIPKVKLRTDGGGTTPNPSEAETEVAPGVPMAPAPVEVPVAETPAPVMPPELPIAATFPVEQAPVQDAPPAIAPAEELPLYDPARVQAEQEAWGPEGGHGFFNSTGEWIPLTVNYTVVAPIETEQAPAETPPSAPAVADEAAPAASPPAPGGLDSIPLFDYKFLRDLELKNVPAEEPPAAPVEALPSPSVSPSEAPATQP